MPRTDTVWPVVHDERAALVRDLETLTHEQWEAPSLCAGWTVHDVLAHLIDSATTTRRGFVRRMIAARGDFDRDNAVGVERERATHPDATLASFRRVVNRTDTPPAALATRLVEAFVHGEDIRRPLGISRGYPAQHVLTALRYQARTPESFGGGRERARAVRLVVTDAGVTIGSGPEATGTATALLLALSGRPVREGEIQGPGAGPVVRR
ncbi:maleylpyruvate isomerase family mycothiol-dependent enzyme [Myceligenerans indicum]|nr:maleylpyruvate isomerase family mycothiol-dependent enzyme [Myceligenerans indicum]